MRQPEVWTPDHVTGRWQLDPLADPARATLADLAHAAGTALLFVLMLLNLFLWSFLL